MATATLTRPEGRLTYTDRGEGPLVVCVPGVGDLATEYRHLEPALLAAGHRVVVLDLRGHGTSDTTFTDLTRAAVGGDVVALLRHLDAGPAHLIGCSLGGSAVAWAAAEVPDLVRSLTLIGAFVRDQPDQGLADRLQLLGLRLALLRPWGPRVWASYREGLFPSTTPSDLPEVSAALRTNLSEPGRMEAMRTLAVSSCADVEARLGEVSTPTLVVMGTADPDWPDPSAEAAWIADRLSGEVVLVEGAGHYPHVEQPDTTATAIVAFLATAPLGA